jgi:acyl carrier protein
VALTASAKSEAEITAWCVAHLAKALRLPAKDIDPQTKFARLGVDSAMAVYLVGELEEWLGRELAPELAFEFPTIAALARHLAGEPG